MKDGTNSRVVPTSGPDMDRPSRSQRDWVWRSRSSKPCEAAFDVELQELAIHRAGEGQARPCNVAIEDYDWLRSQGVVDHSIDLCEARVLLTTPP